MKTNTSYGQILKSSSVMGAAASISMLLGMIRIKSAAILMGTGGVGLIAGFTAIQDIVVTLAGLGIQSSAVREIAGAAGKGDDLTIGRVVCVLRRICLLTGLAGMLTVMVASPWLSRLTFDSDAYTLDIAALGIVILLVNLSNGQLALLQGMRCIGDIARVNIGSAVFGVLMAIGLYYWLGVRGIVPSFVSAAAIQMIFAWRFARRIPVLVVRLTWVQTFREASEMIKLGLVVMWTALMVSGTSYFTILLITQELDLNAVGLYSAAFTLSGISANLVLGAMATDYYPRLVSVAHEKPAVNRLVNEQTEVGLTLALPGLLATLTLAPWVLQIFYTQEFVVASSALQWFVLGCIGRVISFPLGFLILALGKARWYFLTETATNLTHIALISFGLEWFGVDGVAMAFFAMNVGYIAVVFMVSSHLTGFNWSADCTRFLGYTIAISVTASVVCQFLSLWLSTFFGLAITLALGIFSLRKLTRLVGPDHLIVRLIGKLPLANFF